MKKLILVCLMLFVAVFPNPRHLSAVDSNESSVNIDFVSDSNKYFVEGKEFEMDSECVNRNSRTFIVARYLIEALDGEISWDDELKTVGITCRRHKISLQIDNPVAKVDGIDLKIDTDEIITPFIYKDRTLVPIRFISESLGGDVSWIAETKRVRLNFTKKELKNICFLHHSCGSNWIREGKIREGLTELGFDFYDHGYNSQGLTLTDGKKAGYSYDVPGDNTNPDGFATIFSQEKTDPPDNTLSHLLQYDVIAFKSCYPVSNIRDSNQLEKYKGYYREIAKNTSKYPDKLFIIVTQPPLVKSGDSSTQRAALAREFADWLKSDELLLGHPNLITFDWFGLLAEDDPDSDNFNNLKEEYSKGGGDNHPNKLANELTAPEFIKFISENAVLFD